MNLDKLRLKLKEYKKQDITFTRHSKKRCQLRKITEEEVKHNIINSERLIYSERLKAKNEREGKFDCYFEYGKYAHRYILVINHKCKVVTVINVRRDWQQMIEKKKKEVSRKRY